MKIKERIKNVGFWVSLISSIFLILGAFGIDIAPGVASEIINAVCSALVVLGIVSDPTAGKGYLDGAVSSAEVDLGEITAVEETASVASDAENKEP